MKEGRSRPMAVQVEHSSLRFFTVKKGSLPQRMKQGDHAVAAFVGPRREPAGTKAKLKLS
jgi:hypothetical protein